MNNEHNTNGTGLAESPLKLPRETNKDINTSPVKQQVNRNQIIGRPIEIIKGKLLKKCPPLSINIDILCFNMVVNVKS